jgi:exo-1,4-beta-D-glucosaminidase
MKGLRGIVCLLACAGASGAQDRLMLRNDWLLQSSAKAGASGATISTATYRPVEWYRVTVPSTVVGALVDAKVYDDPFFGMNFRSLPGVTYKIGSNFVHTPIAPESPFYVPWWYRTTFRIPASMRGKRLVLHFDGISYRANVWLNGKRIGDSTTIAGSYRRHELDITGSAKSAGDNVLAVQVFAPTPADLQTTWVDWNPAPPDKDMGLWQPVYVTSSRDVVIRYPMVASKVDTSTLRSADLTVAARLLNLGKRSVRGTLRGSIGNVAFAKPVTIAPGDSQLVRFSPDDFPQLRLRNARLWWPAELGNPELYNLSLEFVAGSQVSDRSRIRFGIREVTSETTLKGARLFRVNGRRILIRGGGWAPDLFFRPQPERQDAQLRYALDMHLNTLRLEGNYENDRFFQKTDSLGLLVMTGWVCCSSWEEWEKWKPEQHAVAAASLRDQIRRLRSHPSVFVWLNGSDGPPPADVEQAYLDVEREEAWPNPTISSASATPAKLSGPSGVKMTGPYDWVPPSYWLQDTTNGGAWAYNTETSAGAAVPPIESMRRMLPAQNIALPPDSVWFFHSAGGQFSKMLRNFDSALVTRYGRPPTVEDYTFTSQLMTYENSRAMFEAYRRNKYGSTGVIHWMFNNAWPSIYWHLFDWYLLPAGGYFGAKKANEPLHVMYSYDDRSIAVVNDGRSRSPIQGIHLRARVLGIDGSEKFSRDTTIDVPADTSLRVLTLPEPTGTTQAYFADLRLTDRDGKPVSTNLYWLSPRMDVLADTSTWYMTAVKSYADFTTLRSMPRADIQSSSKFSSRDGVGESRVTLTNTGRSIAFFIRLQIVGEDGEEALPVLWEDNYVSLVPGESRTITASYQMSDVAGNPPELRVSGWNIGHAPLPPASSPAGTTQSPEEIRLHNDWAFLSRYAKANAELPPPARGENRVVFMGNSITEMWTQYFPAMFPDKPYINRGIGGQTTPQMLVRFRQDVVALKPKVVVILAGTNDIAGNTGPSTVEMIENNLASMAEIAKANGIRVVLSSVLPVYRYTWKPEVDPVQAIATLNQWMKEYARTHGAVYLDYYTAMKDEKLGMRSDLTTDGVHVNEAGYRVMAPLAIAAIEEALRK